MHRLTAHHADGWAFNQPALFRLDGWSAIERPTQRVNHPTEQLLANWHIQHRTLAADAGASLDLFFTAKDHRTDFIFHQVQGKRFHHATVSFNF